MGDIDINSKILWDYLVLNEKLTKANCILGLGSQDKEVAKYCSKLFLENYALFVIFSGGKGRLTPKKWKHPEAEEFKKIAVALGIPRSKIFIENKSTNTKENIQFTKKLISRKKMKIKKIIVVTQPFLQKRAKAVFKKYMPDVKSIFSYSNINFEKYTNPEVSKEELINMLVGEAQRLVEYPRKGYIPRQVIPKVVKKAVLALINSGYRRYVI